jgi:hypothetical protein
MCQFRGRTRVWRRSRWAEARAQSRKSANADSECGSHASPRAGCSRRCDACISVTRRLIRAVGCVTVIVARPAPSKVTLSEAKGLPGRGFGPPDGRGDWSRRAPRRLRFAALKRDSERVWRGKVANLEFGPHPCETHPRPRTTRRPVVLIPAVSSSWKDDPA